MKSREFTFLHGALHAAANAYSALVFVLLLCAANAYGHHYAPPSAGSTRTGSQNDGNASRFDESAPPERKIPGIIFNRPKKKTPREQFEYASLLEKDGRFSRARKAYDSLVHTWGDSAEAVGAQYGVARMTEKCGRPLKAFREYQYLLENYNVSFIGGAEFTNVLQRQFLIADAMRGRLGRGVLGIGAPNIDTVAGMFGRIADSAPAWECADDCLFLRGLSYETVKMYANAIYDYENLASRYPDSELKSDALYRAAICRYSLAEKNPRDEKTLRNAAAALGLALSNDPGHELSESTAFHMAELTGKLAAMAFEKAEFYDVIRHNPKASIAAYGNFLEEFPDSPQAETARRRISELSQIGKKDGNTPEAKQK